MGSKALFTRDVCVNVCVCVNVYLNIELIVTQMHDAENGSWTHSLWQTIDVMLKLTLTQMRVNKS